MSDDLGPKPIPIMKPEKARDIARAMQAFALQMEALGNMADARLAQSKAAWWLHYAAVLAQLAPEAPQ